MEIAGNNSGQDTAKAADLTNKLRDYMAEHKIESADSKLLASYLKDSLSALSLNARDVDEWMERNSGDLAGVSSLE